MASIIALSLLGLASSLFALILVRREASYLDIWTYRLQILTICLGLNIIGICLVPSPITAQEWAIAAVWAVVVTANTVVLRHMPLQSH